MSSIFLHSSTASKTEQAKLIGQEKFVDDHVQIFTCTVLLKLVLSNLRRIFSSVVLWYVCVCVCLFVVDHQAFLSFGVQGTSTKNTLLPKDGCVRALWAGGVSVGSEQDPGHRLNDTQETKTTKSPETILGKQTVFSLSVSCFLYYF